MKTMKRLEDVLDFEVGGHQIKRVFPGDLENELDSGIPPQYYRFPDTCVIVCCLTTRTGFHLIGHSCPVDPELFDAETGEKIAFENAREQLWRLLGFRLRDQIAAEKNIKEDE